jgi:hypothetical protein
MPNPPPPQPAEPAEITRRKYLNHEASVKSIGSLYYLSAALCLFSAIVGPFLHKESLGSSRLLSSLLLIGFAVGFFYMGKQFRALNPKIRIAGVVLACIGLVGFPIGTLVNAYILYLLLSRKGKYIFSDEYKEIILETPHVKYKMSKIVLFFAWLMVGLMLLAVFFTIFHR